jgi:hypothetical protein
VRAYKSETAFGVINPQLVVDHTIKEQELGSLFLVRYGNNVHVYLTSLQEKLNKINTVLLNEEEYPACLFNTTMFA